MRPYDRDSKFIVFHVVDPMVEGNTQRPMEGEEGSLTFD
jgi:hypothetical protein